MVRTGRFFAGMVIGVMLSNVSFGYSGWIAGKVGNALAFDGANDYVEVTGYQGIAGNASRTCCAWIKTTAVQQGNIISWGTGQNGQKWMFRVEPNGTLAVGVYGGYVCTTATVNNDQWHHVAAVLNNDGSPSVNEIQLYIDGILKSTNASTSQAVDTQISQNVVIGALLNSGIAYGFFKGLMDEVCIYDRALNASEIGPQGPVTADGIVAHWAMDETAGSIVHDSVSSYDGTLRYIHGNYPGGDGTAGDPYQINSVSDWQTLMATSADWKKHFILTADIDFQGVAMTPVGNNNPSFTGVFNGNNHTLRNVIMNMPGSSYVGLFGMLGNYPGPGQVSDLTVESVSISGLSFVGGLIGYNFLGSVINCHVKGTVTGSALSRDVGGLTGSSWGYIGNCHADTIVNAGPASHAVGGLTGSAANYDLIFNSSATGSVSAGSNSLFIGGLAGYTYCPTVQCYATGAVTAGAGSSHIGGLVGEFVDYGYASLCYATGDVYGNSNSRCVGGFTGSNSNAISNCYAAGAVNGGIDSMYVGGFTGWLGENGNLTACFATGSVSNFTSKGGGLVGNNNLGAVNYSFWDMDASGMKTSQGGTGKTTAEMRMLSTFVSAGWDFTNEMTNGANDYWRICEDGIDYPRLNWESVNGDFQCPDGVSIEDLDYFVGRWLLDNCTTDNNYCDGADEDGSGSVDLEDYAVLAEHWLEGI